jgi:hypothetical protein
MPLRPAPVGADDLLKLAREDRHAAAKVMAAQTLEVQVALVCDTPLAQRPRMLELVPQPEQVIPLLPEAELCFTAKAIGLGDSGWLLAYASPEQVQACVDLDAWSGAELDRARLDEWLAAFGDGGVETLVEKALALDPELLVLYLRSRIEVFLRESRDAEFEPPPGTQSLDGQFYFRARRGGDDLELICDFLQGLFESHYWTYFRVLQGVIWEDEPDLEEFALRWRRGRLQDLGFPDREEAMKLYARIAPRSRDALPDRERPFEIGEWTLPIWMPELPARADAPQAVFRAASRLGEHERRSFFFAFVALANRVAVADGLALGDPDSIPAAISKAADVVGEGLARLATVHDLDEAEVLRRVSLERLFRVGASLRKERMASRSAVDDEDEVVG